MDGLYYLDRHRRPTVHALEDLPVLARPDHFAHFDLGLRDQKSRVDVVVVDVDAALAEGLKEVLAFADKQLVRLLEGGQLLPQPGPDLVLQFLRGEAWGQVLGSFIFYLSTHNDNYNHHHEYFQQQLSTPVKTPTLLQSPPSPL